ncbi:DNA adenine methylase [Chitinophaga tropicalis]|uniref:site-specific DNA-methyltransferase (adenine-specific) n=1 Tax=Chitinophaga tropicalis TaxID=2683588 RepID=A0A7K1U110_9BACT|nr:DNA adenine methylase [Chitinophaga tropicalis]MVT07685.1 DNA adenine methylase [Chitinophaga tropicalis]
MKGLLTYYGGKQKLAPYILELIPTHVLYAEPFAGGAAVFFNKRPSRVEVLNDTNGELMNFYKVVKSRFDDLFTLVTTTLHSREEHQHAWIIYSYPKLFDEVKRAWAVWVLSMQGFSGQLNSTWGYDVTDNTTSKKNIVSRHEFTRQYARRLEGVQLENANALYIIKSRDHADAFFYCDPPYFNSHLGHYKGYSKEDFIQLLEALQAIKGKFLLSSYPSKVLEEFVSRNGWQQQQFEQLVTVNIKNGNPKSKTEVLTSNYPLLPNNQLLLF